MTDTNEKSSLLTFVGVVFVTASFVSPGWVNCKLSYLKNLIYLDQLVYVENIQYAPESHNKVLFHNIF